MLFKVGDHVRLQWSDNSELHGTIAEIEADFSLVVDTGKRIVYVNTKARTFELMVKEKEDKE